MENGFIENVLETNELSGRVLDLGKGQKEGFWLNLQFQSEACRAPCFLSILDFIHLTWITESIIQFFQESE